MRRSLLAVALLAASCKEAPPPEGQVVLHVVTDAVVPPAAGVEPSVAPLFSRLEVVVVPAGSDTPCEGCTRDFALDAASFVAGPPSFGIAAPSGRPPRVRLRLSAMRGAASSDARPASTIERWVQLPDVGVEGIVDVTVTLLTEDVAAVAGSSDEPLPPVLGAPSSNPVGTFAGARRIDCPAPSSDGEICVPGGAFWKGDPRLVLSAAEDLEGEAEQLVVVSPFHVDRAEVTVGAFRASGLARSLTPGGPFDDPHVPDASFPDCTFTQDAGENEALPINCLTWERASEYCASVGKQLPTEAQLEWMGSGLGMGRYPWGDREPSCEEVVFHRDSRCQQLGGLMPAGAGSLDRLEVADGAVLDLAGSLYEFARDHWQRDEEPCHAPGLVVDPWCRDESTFDPDTRSVRGGSWQSDVFALHAAIRTYLDAPDRGVSARVGFRCVRPAD